MNYPGSRRLGAVLLKVGDGLLWVVMFIVRPTHEEALPQLLFFKVMQLSRG